MKENMHMKNEANFFQETPIFLYLRDNIKAHKDYEFKEFLNMLDKQFKNINSAIVNKTLKDLEFIGDLVKIKQNNRILYRSTKELTSVVGIVQWQSKNYSLVLIEDENGILNGDSLYLNKKESSRVLNGERIVVKRIPYLWNPIQGLNDIPDLNNMDSGIVIDVLNTSPCYTIGENVGTTRNGWLGAIRICESMFTQVIRLSEKHESKHNEQFNLNVKEKGTLLSGFIRRTGNFDRMHSLRAWFDVKTIIGKWSMPGIETKLAIEWMKAEDKFSNIAMSEAYNLTNISVNDLFNDKNRKDLRNLPFVTIDGPYAKDLDDAICAQMNPDGSYKVFVAIADVSRYILPGSILDNVAKKRSTTLYFPHKSIPMIPDVLSVGLCSLNEGVERAVMTCEADVLKNGEVKNVKFYPAVIVSKAKLQYAEVNSFIIEKGYKLQHLGDVDKNFISEDIHFNNSENIKDVLNLLILSSDSLRGVRNPLKLKKSPEIWPIVGENGKAQSLRILNEMTPANKLVEEFMCLVNREAAKLISKTEGAYALFRNHALDNNAEYSVESLGHYAFSNQDYMHFTSPLRRYPDLLAHRAMKKALGLKYNNEPTFEEISHIGKECTKINRLSKSAADKARQWLILEYAERQGSNIEPVEILEEFENNWFVYGRESKIPGYIAKPNSVEELKKIKENGLFIKVDRVDYFSEKVFFELANPQYINKPENKTSKYK